MRFIRFFGKTSLFVMFITSIFVGCLAFHTHRPQDISVNVVGENATGSGVIVKSSPTDSLVLTNRHVCDAIDNGHIDIVLPDKSKVAGDIIKRSNKFDLCLIKINKANLPTASILVKHRIYQKIFNFSSPSGKQFFKSSGYLGADRVEVYGGHKYNIVMVSLPTMRGMSGSGVFDVNDNLIGILFIAYISKYEVGGVMGQMIPASDVIEFLGDK